MSKRLVSLTFVALLGAFAPLARAQQDTIVMKDGKERKTKILSEDYDSVKFSLEGGTQDLRWKQIDSIRYSGAEGYDKAVTTYTSGKTADAIPLLEALAADTKQRNVLRQGTLYYLGLAYKKQGDTDKSIATFEQLLTDFPKSRYLTTAAMSLLAAYREKGNAAGAAKSIDAALTQVKSGSDAGLDAEINLLKANLALAQGKLTDAERTFSSAASASGAAPSVVAEAKLGMARVAQANKQTSDAENKYREIVKGDASNVVLAAAWNGLGDIALEAAMGARDRDGLRVALFAYMRGAVLYTPGRDDPTEEHERALAGSSKAFKAMGELEGNAERKKQALDRAKERLAYLQQKYPRSRFLKPN
jgi:tetratricopeptide (TPR) repeat protein